ncbi:hypothetical protein MPTA5024_36515 [Microbispora sp. ATCC PTA-5024]|nr:hypothetical protein MPTA5024_36515 [Microbispora sp. ATCC PTA-5024]
MPSVSGPRSTLSVASAAERNAVVVRLAGDLDAGTVHVLREELKRVWDNPPPVLVLEVGEVAFCDSRGLSELIAALQRGQATNVRLALAGVQGVLARVLTITGLRKVFEQYGTVAEALDGTWTPDAGGPGGDHRGDHFGGLFETAGDR